MNIIRRETDTNKAGKETELEKKKSLQNYKTASDLYCGEKLM
jgi:hypothetical protein